MSITIEATYENGVLKPANPLPLDDRQKVQVTINTAKSPLLEGYGIMGFTGSAELAEYFAMDPELEYSQIDAEIDDAEES
jgi:predicted DNA-binding antitoxin AbrB/MazE fold protein